MLLQIKNTEQMLKCMAREKSLPPAVIGLLVQIVAFLLVMLGTGFSQEAPSSFGFAFAQGMTAACLAWLLKMPVWWWLIELLFAPALLAGLNLQLPSWWYLAGFFLLSLIYWSVFRTRVPLFLSSQQAHAALQKLLPERTGFSMIDLGCGVGGVLVSLSKMRPDGSYQGVETAPLPYLLSKLRSFFSVNCTIRWGDFWQQDMGEFDLVYAYLSPVPMSELWQKLRSEMKPGSLFVSNTFGVYGQTPDYSIPLEDLSGSVLHVWRM